MKYLKILFLFVLMSCSSTKVVYDYDSKMDFTTYKTFNYFEDVGKGLNELDVKRITNELSEGLQQKGMRLSDTPDFYINIVAKDREAIRRNTIGVGIGGGGNVGFGISGGIPIGSRKINQEITVDFVESKTNNLIWNGIANSEIKERTTPEERLAHYKKVIIEILKGFPPNKKK
ncbi:DUF4136 domain-containing protein [Tenacibaculum sp. S7007]|uniref:DUF4136 domain-containing protein n=1 Tax=Tenacibaculum pelagium TaxID=2759527 RepID=A0A839AKL7_9FLAO|nr:DUF4136 domain-containing protein [Tenacibaculum pelagium]MBA6155615.1 DUF4136 domain-containing protein [Tenacibaculum pelagium]